MTKESRKVVSSVNHVINNASALVIAKKIPVKVASILFELCETIISLNRRIEARISEQEKAG